MLEVRSRIQPTVSRLATSKK